MNESLCNEVQLKQAHMSQVDFYIKRLFSFNRLPVGVFEKLMALREEDGDIEVSEATTSKSKVKPAVSDPLVNNFIEGQANFFLSEGTGLDLSLKEGEGYDEIAIVNKPSNANPDEDNAEMENEEALKDLQDVFDCRGLSQQEIDKR